MRKTERKIGAAGKPVIHCEARVVDENGDVVPAHARGEIQLRGPNLLLEYFKDSRQTQEAFDGGWFRTGDIGHVDGEGFIYIDDRKKDVIISGGENVYPAELENILAEMTELSEYAAVGRPSERWGEEVVLCVVPRAGIEIEKSTLLQRFEGRLARYKHPRDVVFFDTLPRNAMGKVLKFRLREQLGGANPN